VSRNPGLHDEPNSAVLRRGCHAAGTGRRIACAHRIASTPRTSVCSVSAESPRKAPDAARAVDMHYFSASPWRKSPKRPGSLSARCVPAGKRA
jgi:hypothetical protein